MAAPALLDPKVILEKYYNYPLLLYHHGNHILKMPDIKPHPLFVLYEISKPYLTFNFRNQKKEK
jgi:hypothetical protein